MLKVIDRPCVRQLMKLKHNYGCLSLNKEKCLRVHRAAHNKRLLTRTATFSIQKIHFDVLFDFYN